MRTATCVCMQLNISTPILSASMTKRIGQTRDQSKLPKCAQTLWDNFWTRNIIMCWRLDCPFKDNAAPAGPDQEDDVTKILIFGITGMTGGAVMDAALGCAWFKVTGFTRSTHKLLHDDLRDRGVTVFTGDMNIPHTLTSAMKNIDTVFLVTTYWDSMSVDLEFNQGVNVVNVAIENAVKHLIYVGTDYSITQATERCKYLEGKALVENYIVSMGIPFTVVHLGFYYENFLSVFKPVNNGLDQLAIALPMGTRALNCGSVFDFGQCIGKIALSPDNYLNKTLNLATAYMRVSDFAEKFSLQFNPVKFYDPWMTLDQYRELDFAGVEELTAMFVHYRCTDEWDTSEVYRLFPAWRTFEKWLVDYQMACQKFILGVNLPKNPPHLSFSQVTEIEWESKTIVGVLDHQDRSKDRRVAVDTKLESEQTSLTKVEGSWQDESSDSV